MRTKRALDVLLAVLLLVPLLPVMGIVAMLVRLLSGNPVLYHARRAGLNGEPFEMYKFRTMRTGSSDAAITGPADARLTGIGRVLRRVRLDETPQILNVLRGDMSFVGPRPEDPRFVRAYTPEQREVLRVRPGITSPTALVFREEASMLPAHPALRDAFYADRLLPAKLALDLDYVRNRSLVGDIRLLAATLGAVLGIYEPPAPTLSDTQAVSGRGSAKTQGTRVVVVLGAVDGFANGVRAREVTAYLERRGHEVRLVDTDRLSRLSSRAGSLGSRLPGVTRGRGLLFGIEILGRLVRRSATLRGRASYHQLVSELAARRQVLASTLDLRGVDLLVAVTPHDASFLTAVTGSATRTLYDCPTPWADELWFEGRLTERQHVALRRREAALMDRVDYLAFHWHSYAEYAHAEYGLRGDNLLELDWGCTPRAETPTLVEPPRVVYLGSLGSRFIDLPLLARLCRLYPHIDVFGGPEPDPALGLPYRGYAPSEVLSGYQFGLITCTDDPLRRQGFSAKHLDYLSAGLPVLAPRWRTAAAELDGTVLYDEASFVEVVETYGTPARWGALSEAASRQAAVLTWDITLQALDDLLA